MNTATNKSVFFLSPMCHASFIHDQCSLLRRTKKSTIASDQRAPFGEKLYDRDVQSPDATVRCPTRNCEPYRVRYVLWLPAVPYNRWHHRETHHDIVLQHLDMLKSQLNSQTATPTVMHKKSIEVRVSRLSSGTLRESKKGLKLAPNKML